MLKPNCRYVLLAPIRSIKKEPLLNAYENCATVLGLEVEINNQEEVINR